MYKCSSCDEIFEEPDICQERIGYYGSVPAYQDFCYCPDCSSDDIEEAEDAYTLELAKLFLTQNDLEEDFYIEYAACIFNHDCDSLDLVELLKINTNIIVDFDNKLKNYCLENRIDLWNEFLNNYERKKVS